MCVGIAVRGLLASISALAVGKPLCVCVMERRNLGVQSALMSSLPFLSQSLEFGYQDVLLFQLDVPLLGR